MHAKISPKLLVVILLASLAALTSLALADAKAKPQPRMKEWEKEVRDKIAKDDKLKALAAKYPLVLLHAPSYAKEGYGHSAFSFIYETSDPEKHLNNVQLLWENADNGRTFETNMVVNQLNLVVDLEKVDFEKNPELGRITIDHPKLTEDGVAREGHVYLERVRDTRGNNFYVLFQVVAVDRDGRYLAFLWRKLPGGKIVKRANQK